MSLKDILVHVGNSENNSAAVRTAFSLSKEFDTHLTGLYIQNPVLLPIYADVNIPQSVFDEAASYEQNLMNTARKTFEELTQSRNFQTHWVEEEGRAANLLVRYSVCYDLVVVGHSVTEDQADVESDIVERLILEAGVPVLAVPENAAIESYQTILVAWNGKKESIRAIHYSMPLLQRAGIVRVVSARTPAPEDIPCADIARHLARHNINVEIEESSEDVVDVGYWLEAKISKFDCDLLVMGAYGHSRYREMIFGGATRHVLRTMPIPCLMAH